MDRVIGTRFGMAWLGHVFDRFDLPSGPTYVGLRETVAFEIPINRLSEKEDAFSESKVDAGDSFNRSLLGAVTHAAIFFIAHPSHIAACLRVFLGSVLPHRRIGDLLKSVAV